MITIYGCGFIGNNFYNMYEKNVIIQGRNERKPKTNNILYFLSTTNNQDMKDNISIDVDTNLKILCEVLNYCKSEDITFNYVSTWFVYGDQNICPVKEDSPCNPLGFYSSTKLCAENLIKSFSKLYGMKYRIIRPCNILGKGDKKMSMKKNVILWFVNQLNENKNITVYDNGEHIRDVLHVSDACRAIKLILDKGNKNETYNVGSGNPTSLKELLNLTKKISFSSGKIISIKTDNNIINKNFFMDIKKLKDLGFKQKISNEEIIKDLCKK